MTTLEALRPTEKLPVYRVLELLNFDLTAWERDQQGNPIDNPAINGRAYPWSFHDKVSGQDVFMLWHAEMEDRDGQIVYRQGWDEFLRELDESRPQTAARADAFLKHISNLKKNAVVRVSIVEGSRAKATDTQASKVARRVLDSEPWHLSFWDPLSNTFEFTRGLPRAAESTPNDVPPADEPDLSLLADIQAIHGSDGSQTEKERLVAARLGQGRFRSEVLARWGHRCAVSGATTLQVIRASHCQPWRVGTNAQRLDPANGLPLVATLDALFDVGLITFGEDGRVRASPHLADTAIPVEGLRLRRPLDAEEAVYMDFHRKEIFKAE
ncbi:MAG: hypothetical protein IPO08_23180 [Xanthomonadales bacterium]|nr:hypothetical protein [Xanthomonadales bacterium]